MKDIWSWIQVMFSAIGGGLGMFCGGMDGFIYALIIFVVIDYITGVMCAVLQKKLSSEIGARGIFKKALIFGIVGVGHIVDSKLIGTGDAIRTVVVFFYLSNEGISILENAGKIGLPIPRKLKAVMEQLNKEDTENG